MTDDEKKPGIFGTFKLVESIKPIREYEPPWDKRPAKALVACYFGKAELLEYQGSDIEIEIEAIGRDSLFEHSMGYPPEDGIWVWEGYLHTSRDYWGEVDCYLEGEYRKATEQEWHRHLKEEYIWDLPSEEHYAWMAKEREASEARYRAQERIIDLCIQYFQKHEGDPEDMPWVLPKLAAAVKEWVEKHR
jgi:hypothetical protein